MILRIFTTILVSILSLNILTAVPDGSPYKLLSPSFELNDELNSNLSMPTFILCFMGQLQPQKFVSSNGAITYLALVDEDSCAAANKVATTPKNESKAGSAAADASSSAASLTPVIVTVSRASSSDPMVVKAWIESTDDSGTMLIYTYTEMTSGMSDENPYGVFNLKYTGQAGNQDVFKGYLTASGSAVNWKEEMYQLDDNGDPFTLNGSAVINVGASDTGNGAVSYPKFGESGPAQYVDTYAYTSSAFCRKNQTVNGSSSGASEVCYDTDEANGKKEVYGYKLFNSTTGEQFDISNQGFNIKYTNASDVVKYGFADFYGLHFDNTTSNALSDGDTIIKSSDSSSYTAEIVKNILRKVDVSKVTLNSIDELRFVSYLNDNVPNVSSSNEYKLYYDSDNSKFIVTHNFACGGDGCFFTKLNSNIEFTITDFLAADSGNLWGLGGWLPGVGGIQISRDAMTTPTSSLVAQELESKVALSDYPTILYCLSNCPRYTEIEAVKTAVGNDQSVNQSDTYLSATQYRYGADNESDLVTYTLNSETNNYGAGDGDVSIGAVSNSLFSKLQSSGVNNGIWSGRLVTAKTDYSCNEDWNSYSYCLSKLDKGEVTTFYRIQTGHERWHQQRGIKDLNGNRVTFNGPLTVYFNAPDDATKYAEFAGQELRLEFAGGSRLNGIPGRCLNTTTGAFTEDCAIAGGGGYYPWIDLFKIPKNETTGRVYTSSGGTGDYYLVGQTDGAVFLGLKAAAIGTLTLGSASDLPSTTITNVGPNGGTDYIGAFPTKPSNVSIKSGVLVE